MAATARFNRKGAPKASTPAEVSATPAPVSAPKPSFWTRVKTTVTKTVAIIVKPFKAIAKWVKPAGQTTFVRGTKVYTGIKARIARVASRIEVSVKRIAMKIAPRVYKFWALSLRPMLAAMLFAFAFTSFLVAAVLAPFTTALAVLGCALIVFGMAAGLKQLELREAAGSWAVALLWIMWRGMRGGVITERSVPEYSEIRRTPVEVADVVRAPRDVTPAMAPNNAELWTRGNYLRATGTEELWGTEWDAPPPVFVMHDEADEGRAIPVVVTNDTRCVACGTDQGATRIRSMNVPFATAGTRPGAPREERPRELLCSSCFALECEDVALALTGVSLAKTSTEVRLNKTGVEHSPEHAVSVFEPEKFVWLVSGWWRDKNGVQFEREHTCLLGGLAVATVVQDHRRRTVFRVTVRGKVTDTGGTKTLEGAKYAAQSDLNDELSAVDRHFATTEVSAVSDPLQQVRRS